MTTSSLILDLLALCAVYSFAVVLIDVVVLFVVYKELSQVLAYLSLVMLAEGGLGLAVGGFIGLNSPIIRRVEEDFFRVKSHKPNNKKELERHAKTFIITGVILVVAALLLSVI